MRQKKSICPLQPHDPPQSTAGISRIPWRWSSAGGRSAWSPPFQASCWRPRP